MLLDTHVTKKASMSPALQQALVNEGIDPAFVLICKKATQAEEAVNKITVHLLTAPGMTLLEANLKKRQASGEEVLSPEGNEVLYLVSPDSVAKVCKKVGGTWLWL